ncbi:MAG: helix-turn-helix transcriptional regulator [Roseivirga sp.]|nr:helix-turn-helix transcriptional regulator [Roseivirga sp.]
MENQCPYCNNLLTAFEHNNYCSKTDQSAESDSGNAFLINTRKLNSGKHTSRFTLRAVLNGYQYHKVGNADCVVKEDNYLIVNKGQTYYTEIDSEANTEAIIVAFGDNEINDVFDNTLKSGDQLIDNVLKDYSDELSIFETAYDNDPTINASLAKMKQAILSRSDSTIGYQELTYDLLEKIISNHFSTLARVDRIRSVKKSTKIELYKRISLAKDFMSANLAHKLSIDEISEVAALSPYHFFRTFKEFYQVTPLEFLTRERLKYASYLLKTTDLPVSSIASDVGFESHSSFTRLFKRNYQTSPTALRAC